MKLKERMKKVDMGALKTIGIAGINLATGDGEMSMEDGVKLLVGASKGVAETMKIMEDALGELDKMEAVMNKLDDIDKKLDAIENEMGMLEDKLDRFEAKKTE